MGLQEMTKRLRDMLGNLHGARGCPRDAGSRRESKRVMDGGEGAPRAAVLRMRTALAGRPRLNEELAQGTTEYAILVGVLVVIAIIAIIAFRDKVSELWEAISSGINSL